MSYAAYLIAIIYGVLMAQPQAQVEFPCKVVRETPSAILVQIEDTETWIPYSQVTRVRYVPGSPDNSGSITFSLFIAKQKGLI